MSLAALPSAFGVIDVKKGFFPYKLNNSETWNKIVPAVTEEDFDSQHMHPKKREEFQEWFEKEIAPANEENLELNTFVEDDVFGYDVLENLKEYCRDDVRVLRICFMRFFEACEMTTGVLPGVASMTIAGFCNRVWRCKFLAKDLVGLVPHRGYVKGDTQSRIALSWLSFLDQCHFCGELEYARKDSGERKIRLKSNQVLKVDGYHKKTNTVFEFYGCKWHGCPKCFAAGGLSYVNNMPMHALYRQTMTRELALVQMGYKVETMWECEWRRQVMKDEETRELMSEIDKSLFEAIRIPSTHEMRFTGGESIVIVCGGTYIPVFSG